MKEQADEATPSAPKLTKVSNPSFLAEKFLELNKPYNDLSILLKNPALKDILKFKVPLNGNVKKDKKGLDFNEYEVHPVSLVEIIKIIATKNPKAFDYLDHSTGKYSAASVCAPYDRI